MTENQTAGNEQEIEKTIGNKIKEAMIPIKVIKSMIEAWIARNPQLADFARDIKEQFGDIMGNTHEMTAMLLTLIPLFLLSAFVLAPMSSFVLTCVYPLLMSVKCVELNDRDDRSRWLVYWLIYNLVAAADYLGGFVFSIVPGYSLVKFFYLLWCAAPIGSNGCAITYNLFLRSVCLIAIAQFDEIVQMIGQKMPACLVSKKSPYSFQAPAQNQITCDHSCTSSFNDKFSEPEIIEQ